MSTPSLFLSFFSGYFFPVLASEFPKSVFFILDSAVTDVYQVPLQFRKKIAA